MRKRTALTVAVIAGLIILLPSLAAAFSQSDTAYFDGLQDLTGVDQARSQNIVLDALGGVRLKTNGAAVPTTWTTQAHFSNPQPPLGPIVGTLGLDANGTPGSLRLLSAPLAFRRAQPGPVLTASAPLSVDGYEVGGMCVQRVAGTYYMWYTGVPENEYVKRLYLATSSDGVTWVKEPTPVLELGAPGEFDSRQIGRPSVIYDAANLTAPFRMWYSAEDDFGGSIGYATSLDGRTWTKAGEVLGPGIPGTADSFTVSQPCVVYDNGIYSMWYTANDSNNLRVAYATSLDGLVWKRGGVVIDAGSGTGNFNRGAWSPAVWKDAGGSWSMVFTGGKTVSGDEIQTKLINASSSDGVAWTAGNIAQNPHAGSFDGYNLSQPTVLPDPLDAAAPLKMWYVGNQPDANGNYHDRIGMLTSTNGSHWDPVSGPLGEPYLGAVLTYGAQSTAFDSMMVADLRGVPKPPAAGSGVYGFYTGTNAADFTKRIGVAESSDGLAWTRLGDGTALIGTGPAGTFDAGGVATPAPVETATGWLVYHTSLDEALAPTIGLHEVSADLQTVTRTASPVVSSGGAFDAAGQADPCAVLVDTQIGLYYAGRDAGGVWSIGLATGLVSAPASLSSQGQVLAPTPGAYDALGVRKPVVHRLLDGTFRMFYAAIDADGVHRIAYATSPDGRAWTKHGIVMNPSTVAYDLAEAGVEPASAGAIGAGEGLYFTGTDRFGRTRVGRANASGPGFLDGGTATYEFDNPAAQDWRRILWSPTTLPTDTGMEVWVSYYPTYSGLWSGFFPVQSDTDLPFLLTVQNMRWQLRMTSSSPAASPQLDELTANHAPIQFPAAGKLVTLPVGPPTGKYVIAWGDLTVQADVPAGATLTATVEDQDGSVLVPATPIVGGQATVIPLAGVTATGSKLIVVFDFGSDKLATAKLKTFGVTYTVTDTPATMTLTTSKASLTYGSSATLTGSLMSDTTPLAGQTITLKARRLSSATFTDIGTVVTGADGTFTKSVKPVGSTIYRAEWPGGDVAGTIYPPAIASTRIDVKPTVSIGVKNYVSRSGKYYRYPLGRKVTVKGKVSPNHYQLHGTTTRGKVTVTVYRYKKVNGVYTWVRVTYSRRSLTTTSGYSWTWTPKARGTYRINTKFAGDVDHLARTSKYRYVKVY